MTTFPAIDHPFTTFKASNSDSRIIISRSDSHLADRPWMVDYKKLPDGGRRIARVLGQCPCTGLRKSLHQIVFAHAVPKGYVIDHINGNPLDNRRENLRLATMSGNRANARPMPGKRFKGVSVRSLPKGKKIEAAIYLDGKKLHLGVFGTEEDAARAYDESAKKLFGEFARLNFPGE